MPGDLLPLCTRISRLLMPQFPELGLCFESHLLVWLLIDRGSLGLASTLVSLCFPFSALSPPLSWPPVDPRVSATCLMAYVICLLAGPLFAGQAPPTPSPFWDLTGHFSNPKAFSGPFLTGPS